MEERIGGALRLSCPEGFHRMTDAEKSGLTTLGNGSWAGFSDPERHMIVTVGWKRVNALVSLLLTEKDLAKNAEKQIARSMRPFGYRSGESVRRTVAGERAEGFRYGYEAQGVGMAAESLAMKHGKTVVYFHLYYREAPEEESLPVWEEILASVRADPEG